MPSEKTSGFGNIVVKYLNGLSPAAAVIAIIFAVSAWKDFNDLKAGVQSHCQDQKDALKVQADLDRNQDDIVNMMNGALVKIQTNTEGLQEDMKDVQADIKKLLERK